MITKYKVVKNHVYLADDCERHFNKDFNGDLVLDSRTFVDLAEYEKRGEQRDRIINRLKRTNSVLRGCTLVRDGGWHSKPDELIQMNQELIAEIEGK